MIDRRKNIGALWAFAPHTANVLMQGQSSGSLGIAYTVLGHENVIRIKTRPFAVEDSGHASYILVEVESSGNGEYKWGTYMLTLADCRRRVQLEFFLGTLRARRESLRKIDRLIRQLELFRAQLRKEAGLITQYEQKEKEANRLKKRRGTTESNEVAKK